jgi:hypothetical protein
MYRSVEDGVSRNHGIPSGMYRLVGNRLEKPDLHNRSVNDLRRKCGEQVTARQGRT